MLSQGRKGQLLQYINDKEFSGAVIYINNLLKVYNKEEVKKFICGPEFVQAFKRLHDEFMKENSENIPVKNDQIQNINIKEYIDVSDDWGMSLLSHAAESGFLDVVDLLCKIDSDVNHVSDNGFTPISLAIIGAKAENESDVLDIVRLLCNSGADVNHVNKDKDLEYTGFTPMRTAIEKCSSNIVKVLCENGANIFVFTNDVMVETSRKDGKEVCYFKDNLKEKGCSPKKGGVSPPKKDQGYKCFDSALHFAARIGKMELILSCIENLRKKIPNQYGGSGFHTSRYQLSLETLLNMKDINGKTALDLAEDNSPEVANILIEELSKLKKPARMYAVTGVQAGCSMQK